MPLMRKETKEWPREVFVQISGSQVGRAIRTGKWKYGVDAPGRNGWNDSSSDTCVEQHLYDLENDPYELEDLAGRPRYRAISSELAATLVRKMAAAKRKQIPHPSRPGGGLNGRVAPAPANPMLKSLAAVLLLLLPVTACATDYYVSPNGDDQDTGTSPIRAWRGLSKVNLMKFKPGDRIFLRGAVTLTGGITLDADDSGTPSNPIVIDSYGTGRANIYPGRAAGIDVRNCGGVEIRNVNIIGEDTNHNTECGIRFVNDLENDVRLEHVRIENVETKRFGEAGIAIIGNNGKSGYRDVIISACVTNENGGAGIESRGEERFSHQDIRVSECQSFDNTGIPEHKENSGNGIVLSSVEGGLIERCVAHHNGSLGNAPGGSAGFRTRDCDNVIIRFNESHGNRTAGKSGGDGFRLDQNVSNSVLQFNYSHDNDGSGFLAAQATDGKAMEGNAIRFNVSRNDGRINQGAGILVEAASDLTIHNNAVWIAPCAKGYPEAISIRRSASISSLIVCNNIFFAKGGSPLVRLASSGAAAKNRIVFQGNSYWTGMDAFIIDWIGKRYGSLKSWRSATGQELLIGKPVGMSGDPGLKAIGRGDNPGDAAKLAGLEAYKLADTSRLATAGIDLRKAHGIDPGTMDFYGNPIPPEGPFSIGVHQVSVPRESAPQETAP